jgi:small subunit ribosomal protein S6e
MAFKLVVSDPKTRKSYQKEVGEEGLVGKKVGEKVQGSLAGLEGFELEVTGGSDKDGFPMRGDVEGTGRKKILISGPPGFHPKSHGMRKRKSVRGNTVSEDIVQINTKVVKYGKKSLVQVFGAKKKDEKPAEKDAGEKKEEVKEDAGTEKKEGPSEKAEEKAEAKEGGAEEQKPEEKEAEEGKEEVKEEPANDKNVEEKKEGPSEKAEEKAEEKAPASEEEKPKS